jgi:hypothetical protein
MLGPLDLLSAMVPSFTPKLLTGGWGRPHDNQSLSLNCSATKIHLDYWNVPIIRYDSFKDLHKFRMVRYNFVILNVPSRYSASNIIRNSNLHCADLFDVGFSRCLYFLLNFLQIANPAAERARFVCTNAGVPCLI